MLGINISLDQSASLLAVIGVVVLTALMLSSDRVNKRAVRLLRALRGRK